MTERHAPLPATSSRRSRSESRKSRLSFARDGRVHERLAVVVVAAVVLVAFALPPSPVEAVVLVSSAQAHARAPASSATQTSSSAGNGAAQPHVDGLEKDVAPPAPEEAKGATTPKWQTFPWGAAECPRGTLPDGDACVRLPRDDEGSAEVYPVSNSHRERSGLWSTYEQIPRRPERPADYDAYVYPVPPGLPGGHHVVSGYDLDRPNDRQRRGATLRATGHGGVDLPQVRGTRITMVDLEHQRGEADVVYVGPLFGTTVVTRHFVLEAGELRGYLLLFGHLEAPAPGLVAGASLAAGGLVGFVGDTGSPELVHLHLEARRLQPGVDLGLHGDRQPAELVAKHGPAKLLASDVSIVCDPRNVLPLR